MAWLMVAAVGVLIMGLLVALQPRRRPDPGGRAACLLGDGTCDFEIVGEASYQDALEQIAGRSDESAEHECRALLLADVENPFDDNAVRVTISGLTVGYVPRGDAPEVRALIHEHGPLECDALIVGGWDRGARGSGHFGVRLDMEWPPQVE